MSVMDTVVLVVDDEEELRLALISDLIEAGYNAVSAKDAFEALEVLRTRPIHIVLSDLKMPGMTGIELLQNMRSEGLDAVFVMYSGYGTQSEILELLRLGGFEFIEKPVRYERLCEVIGKAAELARSPKGMS